MQVNRQMAQAPTEQNMPRYTVTDEGGNTVTLTPQEAWQLAELLQSMKEEIQADVANEQRINTQQPQRE